MVVAGLKLVLGGFGGQAGSNYEVPGLDEFGHALFGLVVGADQDL